MTVKNFIIDENGTLTKYTGNMRVVYIPSGVKAIGTFAFRNISFLSKVYIPESVKTIAFGAFFECKDLKEIVVENNKIESIDKEAFVHCPNLENKPTISAPAEASVAEESTSIPTTNTPDEATTTPTETNTTLIKEEDKTKTVESPIATTPETEEKTVVSKNKLEVSTWKGRFKALEEAFEKNRAISKKDLSHFSAEYLSNIEKMYNLQISSKGLNLDSEVIEEWKALFHDITCEIVSITTPANVTTNGISCFNYDYSLCLTMSNKVQNNADKTSKIRVTVSFDTYRKNLESYIYTRIKTLDTGWDWYLDYSAKEQAYKYAVAKITMLIKAATNGKSIKTEENFNKRKASILEVCSAAGEKFIDALNSLTFESLKSMKKEEIEKAIKRIETLSEVAA